MNPHALMNQGVGKATAEPSCPFCAPPQVDGELSSQQPPWAEGPFTPLSLFE